MTDYLQPVGLWSKRFALVSMIVACAVCALITAALIAGMIERRSFQYHGKPIWIGAVMVAVMTITSGWLAIRLLAGKCAANGVTVMPVWFIEVFGVLFLVGLVMLLFTKHVALALPGGIGVGLSMLLIRSEVRRRAHLQINQPSDSSNAQTSEYEA